MNLHEYLSFLRQLEQLTSRFNDSIFKLGNTEKTVNFSTSKKIKYLAKSNKPSTFWSDKSNF